MDSEDKIRKQACYNVIQTTEIVHTCRMGCPAPLVDNEHLLKLFYVTFLLSA